MTQRVVAWLAPLLACAAIAKPASAVTATDFQVQTMGELVDLCSATGSDPMTTAAINFCHGFAVGVYQTLSEEQLAMRHKLFCPRQPMPTRNQAIANLVAWAKANPSVTSEAPADGILHYLTAHYPCA